MKKSIITSALLLMIITTVTAQKNLFAVDWGINFPNNNGYLTKTSYSGGKLDYRHFFKQNMSFGFALDWASYEQYIPRQTFQKADGSGAVTSDFDAVAYQVPFTGSFHYYFDQKKRLRPYVGAALGGQYLEQSLYYNVYVTDDDNWGFVARPEVGLLINPNSKYWGLQVAA
ncbi:MAG TPA: hypothetical protein VGG71_12860, partial [Chitinophagaceae bacterium]